MDEQCKEVYVYIKEDDIRLQEIFSRVKNVRSRTDFVREAMVYWYFILKNSHISSRNFYMDSSEKTIVHGLLPDEYYKNRLKPSIKDKYSNYKESITIRFTTKSDDLFFPEIMDGVFSLSEFAKEAIIEWDCLLNHSNIFISRYITKREDTNKSWGNALRVSEYSDEYNVPIGNAQDIMLNQNNGMNRGIGNAQDVTINQNNNMNIGMSNTQPPTNNNPEIINNSPEMINNEPSSHNGFDMFNPNPRKEESNSGVNTNNNGNNGKEDDNNNGGSRIRRGSVNGISFK